MPLLCRLQSIQFCLVFHFFFQVVSKWQFVRQVGTSKAGSILTRALVGYHSALPHNSTPCLHELTVKQTICRIKSGKGAYFFYPSSLRLSSCLPDSRHHTDRARHSVSCIGLPIHNSGDSQMTGEKKGENNKRGQLNCSHGFLDVSKLRHSLWPGWRDDTHLKDCLHNRNNHLN